MSDDRETGYATRNLVPATRDEFLALKADLDLLRRLVEQELRGRRTVTFCDGIAVYRYDGDPVTETGAGDRECGS